MDGVIRKKEVFSNLNEDTIILKEKKMEMPPCQGRIFEFDSEAEKIKIHDRALSFLTVLAKMGLVITIEMLRAALKMRFDSDQLQSALSLVNQVHSR